MAESLETGFILMLAGMGTVYVLLTLLVWLVQAVSKLSRWLEPPVAAPVAAPAPLPSGPAVDSELLRIISAAVQAHRERHRPQRERRE